MNTAWSLVVRNTGNRSLRFGMAALVGIMLLAVIGCSTPPAAEDPTPTPTESASPSPTPTMTPVTIDYGTTGFGFWQGSVPWVVADARGFFAEQGISINVFNAQSSAAVCQQLMSEAVQIGGCSANDMIQVNLQTGFPLVQFVGTTATAYQYNFMASRDIESWDDVRGGTIIIGGPTDNTVYYTRLIARANGLEDDEYDFQYAGSSGARLGALESGAVDVAILGVPFNHRAADAGFTDLGSLVPEYVNADTYSGSGDVVRREWAEENPDIVVRWINAYHNAVEWLYDPANKDELFEAVGEHYQLDREQFEVLYEADIVRDQTWLRDQRISESGFQGILDSLVELEQLSEPTPPVSNFVDMTWVDMASENW